MPDNFPWLLVGDFNLMRRPKNRNKPGGDINEMLLFNEALSALGVIELPLQGKKFTWSNKQHPHSSRKIGLVLYFCGMDLYFP